MIQKLKITIKKYLKKSQKYTNTDNIYIAKHGSYLTAGSTISTATSIILSIAFARLLPKETYGQYKYILSIMAIIGISSLQGLNTAVVQGVAKGSEGVFKHGFKTKLKWSLLGSIAAIGLSIYFWFQANIGFTFSFLAIAILLPFFKSGELFQSYLDGKKLFGKRVTYNTLIQILASISIIFSIFITKNLAVLILVYLLSYSILRILFSLWVVKKIEPNKINDPKIISYGKHISLIGVLGIVAQQIDKVLLFAFLGPAQLAIYSFAVLPIEYIRRPLQNIQELALPKLTVRSTDEIKKNYPKKLLKSTISILVIIIIYIFVAPFLFNIIYPQYTESIFYSKLYSFTLLIFPVSMVLLALQAKMKHKELYKINILNAVIRITLFAILIPYYGILGIIVAVLISQFFCFFLAWYFFKRI